MAVRDRGTIYKIKKELSICQSLLYLARDVVAGPSGRHHPPASGPQALFREAQLPVDQHVF
jgi:hypothetical protein